MRGRSGGQTSRIRYEALAAEIDRVYQPRPLGERLAQDARALGAAPGLPARLALAEREYAKDASALNRYAVTARLLADLRTALPAIASPALRLRAIDLRWRWRRRPSGPAPSFRPERPGPRARRRSRGFAPESTPPTGPASSTPARAPRSRRPTRRWGRPGRALRLPATPRYLGLVPGWSAQTLRQHFGEAMQKLGEIEPMADLFIQDQLRGSPVLFYARGLDRLSRDANRLAGVQHRLLGRDVGAGLNALNPGLARGVLHAAPAMKRVGDFARDGIYLLPETVAALPPVAGILTTGAGNPLSHVQLLARNLGIPNVAVDESLVAALRPADGKRVVLAVSPAGLVELAEDGPPGPPPSPATARRDGTSMFSPDLAKLDLSMRDFVSLDTLRARDSGRIVGPKAAKLGELRALFPDRVAPGVGIPFGVYRETVLDRPYRNTGQTVYQWMVERFRALEGMPPGSREAGEFAEKLRAEIYAIVRSTEPGPAFRQRLQGGHGEGVRTRFQGRGLRALGHQRRGPARLHRGRPQPDPAQRRRVRQGRQGHRRGVGVPVHRPRLRVAASAHEGPGARLSGGAAPAHRSRRHLRRDDHPGRGHRRSRGPVGRRERGRGRGGGWPGRRVAQDRHPHGRSATDGHRDRAAPDGPAGHRRGGARAGRPAATPCSRPARSASSSRSPRRSAGEFPRSDDDGKPAAADIEFAFVNGKLWLLQIRPLNESRQAQGNRYLVAMDRALAQNPGRSVDMRAVAVGIGRHVSSALVCAAGLLLAETAAAYPLDGYPETGIRRLLGISLAVQGVIRDVAQPPGALLPMKDVDLRLEGQTLDLPSPDPAFTAQVKGRAR